MKKLIEKIGMDKIAHFGVGGLICALLTLVLLLQEGGFVSWKAVLVPFIGSVVVFIISWLKEKLIDEVSTWADLWFAMLGCVMVFIAVAIGVLFNLLSQ